MIEKHVIVACRKALSWLSKSPVDASAAVKALEAHCKALEERIGRPV